MAADPEAEDIVSVPVKDLVQALKVSDQPKWAKKLMASFIAEGKYMDELDTETKRIYASLYHNRVEASTIHRLWLKDITDLYSWYARSTEGWAKRLRCFGKFGTAKCGSKDWVKKYIKDLDDIYETYIKRGVDDEINIDDKTRTEIKTKKEAGWKHGDEFYKPEEIWRNCERELIQSDHRGLIADLFNDFKKTPEYEKKWASNFGENYNEWKKAKTSASAQQNYFNEMIGMEQEQGFIGYGQDSYHYSPHRQFVEHQYDRSGYIYYDNNNNNNNNNSIMLLELTALIAIIIFVVITIIILVIISICFIYYYIKKQTKPIKANQKQQVGSYSDQV